MAASVDKRQFTLGVVGLITFLVVLVVFLAPVFGGRTGMQAADDLFNSLSKNSSYYIPDVMESAKKFEGKELDFNVTAGDAEEADKTRVLLEAAGAGVTQEGTTLKVRGDLGAIAATALADADSLFQVRKGEVQARYGFPAREAVYYWYNVFKAVEKKALKENLAKEALFAKKVQTKALEPAYNFTGIPPASIGERMGVTVGLLVFYIVYTIWWGVSVLLIFEGLGITASKPAVKKEA